MPRRKVRHCQRCGRANWVFLSPDAEVPIRVGVMHGHHIWPKATGGPEDGPKADLCGPCHQEYHHHYDTGHDMESCQQSFERFCATVPPMLVNHLMTSPDTGSYTLAEVHTVWCGVKEFFLFGVDG